MTTDPNQSEDIIRFLDYEPPDKSEVLVSAHEWEILDDINRKVAAHISLDNIIHFVFESMRPIRSSDRLGLAFIEENGKRVVLRHVVADYEPLKLVTGYSGNLHGSSLKNVVDDKAIRIINDLGAYMEAHPRSHASRLVYEEGIRSSMTCPLYVEERCVGLVFWSSRRTGTYDESVVRRHQAVAERLSQAVGNAYLIEQLKNVNNAYTDMLGFVSHELKDPIAAIITNATILCDGYLGEMTDEQTRKVGSMKLKAEYLLGIVKQYLNLARIEAGKLRPDYVAVEDVVTRIIEPSIAMQADNESRKTMQLERDFPEGKTPVECDPDLVIIVLSNLLSNAFKYGSKEGTVRISLTRDDRKVTISVYNDGPGFSKEESKLLFRRFSRLPSHRRARKIGTGVGLYMSWNIITAHRGRIWADSSVGEWAQFSFTLPLRDQTT